MADKQTNQAVGSGGAGDDPVAQGAGKGDGGESGGGDYPNAQSGKSEGTGGFMGHGGQTEVAYSGTGQGGHDDDPEVGNENAVTKE